MKFSEQWLRQWVNIDVDTQTLVNKITMAGLEVDNVEPVAADFSGIVVAEIIACDKHPDADKLRVTRVSTGKEEYQVVCGAPNARLGIRVPLATMGSMLSDNFKIKKTTIRGVDSFGMLCAAAEMGMAESSDGLMELPADAPLGQNIREYLKLEDCIIDVDLTPNRGDCLSIAGLAREVSANFLAEVSEEVVSPVTATINNCFPIHITAKEGCPRYIGRVIKDIDINRAVPLWLVESLRRAGLRSIDPIVDVTNYVMLEVGQPMHAFNLNALNGSINVRMAEADEKLVLLDGQNITLTTDTLVIADEHKPLAIAGIMGGEGSGVNQSTTAIFLESAFFNPITVAGKARAYGLHTDSSHRFERGVDYQLQRKAIERATVLILDLCGGQPGPVIEVVNEDYLPKQKEITLHSEKVNSLLGVTIEDSHIEALLTRLGLDMVPKDNASGAEWQVTVPSWRFDIEIEEDLVEELGRIYGYDNLPTAIPSALLKMKQEDESLVSEYDLRRLLVSRGYQETISFSFIDPLRHKLFDPQREAVTLANPIASDLSVMRTSLLPGLVKIAAYNLNRQQSRVRVFEIGQVFINEDKGLKQSSIKQEQKLAAVITGGRFPEGWQSGKDSVDFYDLKGDVEALLAAGGKGKDFHFVGGEHPAMHPGQCAVVWCGDKLVGHVGAIHPSIAKKMGVSALVYLLELSLESVINGTVSCFEKLSKFPEVRRDLALIVEESCAADNLCKVIQREGGEWLREVRVFDVYMGKGVEVGYKSLAISLTLQDHSRTLKDQDVNNLVDKVVAKLEKEFNASLRA